MNIRKKLLVLVVLVMGVIIFLPGFRSGSAQAQKAIEWRMVSSFGLENPNPRTFLVPLLDKVNERAKGRLKISWVGPEAVPPFQQLKPVREGLFDALFTHSAYHAGEVQVGQGLDLFPATPEQRRDPDLMKIIDEAYRKKAGVTFFSNPGWGVGYQLLLRKRIDRADLTGLKIRTTPFYDPMIKALGGVPVRIAPGEIYSALEKGVVDGANWMGVGALDFKFQEVTKYFVRPFFGNVSTTILVNLNSWNQLPQDLRDLLTKAAIENEKEGRTVMIRALESEEKELQRLGGELLVLPPKEAKKYLDTFYERSWEELVLKADPEFGPRLKEVVDRLIKK